MHLKNWSLLENGKLIELAPAYDLLNTRILTDDDEESALQLDEKKTDFDRALLVDYFGREICGLNDRMIECTRPLGTTRCPCRANCVTVSSSSWLEE
ncbi:MAG: HipA domain-containing protein, partial [Desulfobacteraceae bacterium]